MTVTYFSLPSLKNIPVKKQTDCTHFERWRVNKKKKFGEGTYGHVYEACENETDCKFIAKEILFYEDPNDAMYEDKWFHNLFVAECMITEFAGTHGFGVPVQSYFLCDRGRKGVMIQDKFDGTLDRLKSLTVEDGVQLIHMLKKMHTAGIFHNDLFAKNVMYKNIQADNRAIRFIDFGLSVAFANMVPAPLRAVDYITLMNSVNNKIVKDMIRLSSIRENGDIIHRQAERWLNTRYENCSSERYLLNHLPSYTYKYYGPAVAQLLAWSVRCSRPNEQKIQKSIDEKLKKYGIA